MCNKKDKILEEINNTEGTEIFEKLDKIVKPITIGSLILIGLYLFVHAIKAIN